MLRERSAANPAMLAQGLAALRRYQEAEREPPAPLRPILLERGGVAIRDYGGGGAPILFVPSLINPPTIFDLAPHKSLLRWLAAGDRRVLLLDWGWPGPERRGLSVAGHIEARLLPLLADLGEPVHLAGYCLGGTMALAAASLIPARSLVTIATPWHFSGFPPESRERLAALWRGAAASAHALGLLPMEVLQTAFWSLDSERTVEKFLAFGAMAPDSDEARAFVRLEDWANDGPPLTEGAARELFEDLFGANVTGRGCWRVGGRIVDPAALRLPLLDIVSTVDRIVPEATAHGRRERLEIDRGHVGMVVGSQAERALWRPLRDWLSRTAA